MLITCTLCLKYTILLTTGICVGTAVGWLLRGFSDLSGGGNNTKSDDDPNELFFTIILDTITITNSKEKTNIGKATVSNRNYSLGTAWFEIKDLNGLDKKVRVADYKTLDALSDACFKSKKINICDTWNL